MPCTKLLDFGKVWLIHMKIKICGLSRKKDIEAVNVAMPDYVGFVFAKSHRQINEEIAMEMKVLLDPRIQVVGVFVNEDISSILRYHKLHIIDTIQLHGDESNDYIKSLREHTDANIIKAIRVKDHKDVIRAREYDSDFLLFDTYQEKEYGGSGVSFDWSYIRDIEKPFFLAGGIHIGNIVQGMNQCNPYGIDVSSGVETDRAKDPKKIMDIVRKIRRGQ